MKREDFDKTVKELNEASYNMYIALAKLPNTRELALTRTNFDTAMLWLEKTIAMTDGAIKAVEDK